MKTELRLGSIVPHGVGGPEAQAMDLIYMCLLHEYGQDLYSRIGINQIGEDLKEFVMKEPGNKVHVNIRYPAYEDFEIKSEKEKNHIRLDVIHIALLRVAEYDKKLNAQTLEAIKSKILQNDFSFDFVLRSFANKKVPIRTAKIIVQPKPDFFDFYAVIEENGKFVCKVHMYKGKPAVFFCEEHFFYGKWKTNNELVITGKAKETELHVFVDECRIELVNLTPYEKPPRFEMMRADISQEERDKAYKDWKHSLPPSIASVIDYEPN